MTTPPQPAGGTNAATLAELVSQLSLLLSEILNAARASSDTNAILQLNTEYAAVQTLVSQATQAQLVADDASFGQAIAGLKTQATMLTDMEAKISAVVKDVATAGRIVGYLAQAIVLISRL